MSEIIREKADAFCALARRPPCYSFAAYVARRAILDWLKAKGYLK